MDSFFDLEKQADIKKELRESLRETQKNIIQYASIVIILSGTFIICSTSSFPDSLQGPVIGLIFVIAGIISLYLVQTSFWISQSIFFTSIASAIIGLSIWQNNSSLLFLIALLVSLVAITTDYWIGATAAGLSTVLIFLMGNIIEIPTDIRVLVTVQIWASFGISLLTLTPLIRVSKESWLSYSQARKLLIQARDTQVELEQTLSDLGESNKQLTRLNQLTQMLYQAAEEARQAKQQFVANVSHELRTPLNMIMGFGEMIFNNPYGKKLPSALLADLGVIVRNSQHLANLVDDVLDMSQLEAGQLTINREEVDFKELIDSAISVVKPLFETKHLDLHLDISEESHVYCDRTRIREVLINLLSNAGRFTQQGFVRLQTKQDGNDHLVIIQDSGPGIAKKDQNKLFQPFQQIDSSLNRRYGGTGLGLSISKSLVDLHGGRIWFESEEGSGTTFYFTLPNNPPDFIEGGAARWLYHDFMYKERTERSKAPVLSVNPRYVVVDRSDTMRRIMNRYYNDIDLVLVSSISEAKNAIQQIPTKALFIKSESLIDAVNCYQESKNFPFTLPVVISTIPDFKSDPLLQNITTYLVKPVKIENLIAQVEKFDLPRRTILVVDDEIEELQLFRRMLLSANKDYRVITAYDGKQALLTISENPPDIILLDLIMPEINGFEFLAIREQDEKLRQIPVIVISAQDPLTQPLLGEMMILFQQGGLHIPHMLQILETFSSKTQEKALKAEQEFSRAPFG